MTTTLLVTQVLQWIVIVGLIVVVVALARQIGVLHERVAPVGALALQDRVEVDDEAPVITANTLAGERRTVGGAHPEGLEQLLLFVSPRCPVCKKMIPIARDLRRAEESLELLLVGDGDPEPHRRLRRRLNLEDIPFVISGEVGRVYGVGTLPYAILVDAAGTVRSKGVVSTREHLESLVVAREEGVGSIQQYLGRRSDGPPASEPSNGATGRGEPGSAAGSDRPTYLRIDREESDD